MRRVARRKLADLVAATEWYSAHGEAEATCCFDRLLGIGGAAPWCTQQRWTFRRTLQIVIEAIGEPLQELLSHPRALVPLAACRQLAVSLLGPASPSSRLLNERLTKLTRSPPARIGGESRGGMMAPEGLPAVSLEQLGGLVVDTCEEEGALELQRVRAAFVAMQPSSGVVTFQAFSELIGMVQGEGAVGELQLLQMYERAVELSNSILGEESDTILLEAFMHVCRG